MTRPARLGLVALTLFAAGIGAAQPSGLASYIAPEVRGATTDGSAVVALTIRANGQVDDAVTLTATDRALANAVRDAVAEWRFERDPELGRGRDARPKDVLRREVVEFDFRRAGVISSMSHLEGARAWLPEAREPAVRTVLRHEADPLSAPRSAPGAGPAGTGPTSTSAAGAAEFVARETASATGSATISFVIDESGRVRIPIVVTAESAAVGERAMRVVRGWRFDPPTQGGEPVLVEDRKTLSFETEGP